MKITVLRLKMAFPRNKTRLEFVDMKKTENLTFLTKILSFRSKIVSFWSKIVSFWSKMVSFW